MDGTSRADSAEAPARGGLGVPLFCAAAASLLAAAFHLHTGFVNDDALITVRYAGHLAGGDGLVYNAGERVLGTSTPLWALLLAAAAAAGTDATAFAVWAGVIAHGAAAGLAAALFRARGAPGLVQALAGLLVATLAPLVVWAGSGMETSLATALVAGFLLLTERRRYAAAGAVGGLATLARPETALVLVAVATADLAGRRDARAVLRAFAAFAAVALAWAVPAWLYYGSPLPNSGFAKRLQVEDWGTYAALLGRTLWDAGPLLPFALVGAVAARRDRARLAPLAGFAALAGGLQLGGFPGCPWYLPVPLFLLVLVAADGAWRVADALGAAGGRALALAALAAPLLVSVRLPAAAHDWKIAQSQIERCHGAVGTWLHDHAPPGVSVAVDNIGYIGHRSRLRIVDMLGLVTPDAAAAIARGERDWAVRHERPGMVAAWSGRGNSWKYLPDDAWFAAEGYREVFRAPLDPARPQGPAYVVRSRLPEDGR